jgi:F-box/leucine-rich repeat protein 2/20
MNLLVSLKSLTRLDLKSVNISDELLTSISVEGLPLRRLVLQYCTGYSFVGLFHLLSKCQRIQHLDLQNADFLNDQHVVQLSLLLDNLVSINLNECKMVTKSALCALVKNCTSLKEIKMKSIGSKSEEDSDSFVFFGVYPRLKSLSLAGNSWLSDEIIIMFASIFPNLQLLDLASCHNISQGICQVFKICRKIRHLDLAYCLRVNLLGINFEIPKLEVLNLTFTMVDDETLHVISKNCRGLLQLSLDNCFRFTKKGVEHVVENCTQLREINLRDCYQVDASVVVSMVLSRPSLRKIIAPPHYRFNSREMELFLHQGCMVC